MLALLLRFLCVKKLPWLGLDSLRDWDIGLLAYMYAGVPPPIRFFPRVRQIQLLQVKNKPRPRYPPSPQSGCFLVNTGETLLLFERNRSAIEQHRHI